MNDLYEIIVDKIKLQQAWNLVKAKGKAGGVDSITIEKFDQQADKYIDLIFHQLSENTYIPEPYQSYQISKNENEFRRLNLPAVKDKIVQVAAKLVIEPIFDKQFLNVSYGYRSGRGPIKAINRIRNRIAAEHCEWVTIADIDNYFDSIKPEILYPLIEKTINSERLMRMIKLWVQIGSLNYRQHYEAYSEGVPQGCVLSPLLSNIYLHPFDVFMVNKGYRLVRYADDFVILSTSEVEGKTAFHDARKFLEYELSLRLNENWKVKKVSNGFEFMHIKFTGSTTGLSDERLNHLTQKLDNSLIITDDHFDNHRIQQTIHGIKAYYGKLVPESTLEKLDICFCNSLTKKISQLNFANKNKEKSLLKNLFTGFDFFSKDYQGSKAKKIEEIKKRLSFVKTIPTNKTKDIPFEKTVQKKRRQYEVLLNKNRELIVSTPGLFLGKSQKGISVKEFGVQKQTVLSHTLANITILNNSVSLSGQLIEWCSRHNIPIDYIGFDGFPVAKIIGPLYPGADLSLAQTKALENGLGFSLVKKMIIGKIKNQIGLIKYYNKYRKNGDADYSEVTDQHISQMKDVIMKIIDIKPGELEQNRNVLMGYEGHAAACYWDMMVRLLSDYIVFEHRERKGATDLVNCMLNYGYGILYSRIWQSLIRKQFNLCISYLHVPVSGKPTLAFDLIEEFRQQAVDKVVFALITKGENVAVEKGLLTPDTRKRLAKKVLVRLNKIEFFRGKPMRLIEIIESQADLMSMHLLGEKNYKPYVAKW